MRECERLAMNKQTARNALVIVGAWSLSGILAWLITLLLIPISNRLIFSGDSGVVGDERNPLRALNEVMTPLYK